MKRIQLSLWLTTHTHKHTLSLMITCNGLYLLPARSDNCTYSGFNSFTLHLQFKYIWPSIINLKVKRKQEWKITLRKWASGLFSSLAPRSCAAARSSSDAVEEGFWSPSLDIVHYSLRPNLFVHFNSNLLREFLKANLKLDKHLVYM